MSDEPRVMRLTLTDFRNHKNTTLRFDNQMVTLTGANGAGKTNILEALSLFSPGRGLRRATYADMAHSHGDGRFAVAADIRPPGWNDGDDFIVVGTGLPSPGSSSRDIRIDRVPAKRSDALSELVSILWLTPAMDGLFTGGASDRRRFFDRMVMALRPSHGRTANRFEQAMRARNKMFGDQVYDSVWFDAVELQMAEAAGALHDARLHTLTLLKEAIAQSRSAITAFPHADLHLSGFDVQGPDPYRALLRTNREADRAAGRTLIGPHRVDLQVRHGPKDVEAKLASTGEQKALLIGLILAQARLVRQNTGQPALLLLDEVAAHLDAQRRAALYDLCTDLGGQTFMTGTDASLFTALGEDTDHFVVDDGQVKRRV